MFVCHKHFFFCNDNRRIFATGSLDILNNIDCLDGQMVDINVQAVRTNPGTLRAVPDATVFTSTHSLPERASDDENSIASEAPASGDEDFQWQIPLLPGRGFDLSWGQVERQVMYPVSVVTTTVALQYATGFGQVHSHLLPPSSAHTLPVRPNPSAVSTAAPLLPHLRVLRQQVRAWCRSVSDSSTTSSRGIAPQSSSPIRSSALDVVVSWLRDGLCGTGVAFNHRQALFLAFAVDLDVSWLHTKPTILLDFDLKGIFLLFLPMCLHRNA